MMRRFLLAPILALVIALWISGAGCSAQVGAPGTDDPGTNPTPGVVDDLAGFYVRYVRDTKYTYDLHRDAAGFNTPCTAAVGESVDCYMEGEELDLFFHGVSLQTNVPSEMCTYVLFSPYYFLRYPVNISPFVVNVDTDKNGQVCADANSNGVCEVGELDPRCPYDYTGSTGPNCCQGDYNSVQRLWDSTKGSYGPATTSKLSYGGFYGDCLSGPATDTQTKTESHIPRPTLSFVEGTGSNEIYKVKSPFELDLRSTTYLANYYDPADHGGFAPAGLTATFAVIPQPYYVWQCLDRADDVVAEIRLHIREWNTKAMYDNRVLNPTGFDDTGNENPPFGPPNPKNDRADWKDWLNVFPGKAL